MLIIVATEQEKMELLGESKYVHNHFCKNFDSDYCSTLMHLYLHPETIAVDAELANDVSVKG